MPSALYSATARAKTGGALCSRRSVKENDVTVVSVFLNPTQFNDKGDLERYPRNLKADCKLVEDCGAQYVFAPSVKEMYPEPDTRHFEFPPQTTVMEGAKRPGHFNGVCQIVSKLFMLVEPDCAYFGEKDYQQIAVVRAMTADLHLPVEIRPCPIVREESGLALSSRNTLLTEAERRKVIGFHFVMVTIGATHHGWIERVAYSHAVGRGLSVCLHISD